MRILSRAATTTFKKMGKLTVGHGKSPVRQCINLHILHKPYPKRHFSEIERSLLHYRHSTIIFFRDGMRLIRGITQKPSHKDGRHSLCLIAQ